MSPKYNIFNFTESYRNAEHKHTILLPVVMGLVVLGSFWLITKTRPMVKIAQAQAVPRNPPPGKNSPAGTANAPAGITTPPKIDLGSLKVLEPEISPVLSSTPIPEGVGVPVARVISPVERTPDISKDGLPLLAGTATKKFTAWMTLVELDHHILALNQGQQVSFWERGHWIVAVEGRWTIDHQEFRIIYEKTPPNTVFQWRYRIAQSRETFSRNIAEFKQEGFSLVQSQAFALPNQTLKYQAVWQKWE